MASPNRLPRFRIPDLSDAALRAAIIYKSAGSAANGTPDPLHRFSPETKKKLDGNDKVGPHFAGITRTLELAPRSVRLRSRVEGKNG
jgi:hypothetical protein